MAAGGKKREKGTLEGGESTRIQCNWLANLSHQSHCPTLKAPAPIVRARGGGHGGKLDEEEKVQKKGQKVGGCDWSINRVGTKKV